jgi:hypothetical protein
VLHHGQALFVYSKDAPKRISQDALIVTRLGKEVLKLGTFKTPEEYISALVQSLKEQGLRVERALVRAVGDDSYQVLQSIEQ